MRITIIGTGYVGLVTGACFAELGHDVLCIDKSHDKIEILKSGKVPFYEPYLAELVKSNYMEGRLSFSEHISDGVAHGTVIFVAVDTPTKSNGSADLSSVETVATQIAENLTEYRLIVEKSTVPVNTGERIMQKIRENAVPGVEFDVASNPEFLREGTAIDDFMRPDRVVIGVTSERASSLLVSLYEPLNAPLLITDIKSAELIKHTANAYLAMKISFINSVANICDIVGADVARVATGIGLDKRIGREFLNPGIGYGGSCFPKDVAAFITISDSLGYNFNILKAVQEVNSEQYKIPLRKLTEKLGSLKGHSIALLGLSFKPNTDDLRNAPSLLLIDELQAQGADVRVFDPVSSPRAQELLSERGMQLACDPYAACEGADAVILVTEWKQFAHLDYCKIRESMKNNLFVDGRNLCEPSRMKKMGFDYMGMGRS